ncbi:hypothetical protein ACFWIB_14590 [Streptomyces sp. NPDC127051]|uniref:hypothetical protein n=1 Tax=Streptomyces sp. NPDC127051 TaxID=3347119 RepID=UPI00364AC2CA
MTAKPPALRAPWTAEQIDALNRFQTEGGMHPFTCGRDHETHRVLVATYLGWICLEPTCDYTQDWAHPFMAQPDSWPRTPWAKEGRHGPTPEEVRAAVALLDGPVEPDNPAATALAQHIADHPVSTVQAAFRLLGMRLDFELHEITEEPS